MTLKTPFIHDNFMLFGDEAERLYHDYAAKMPIIDYHCHLPPEEVAQDKTWDNLTQVWLNGDHYKWRQMRTNGIAEKYCTGDATDREKFDKFAEVMPYLLRNPLYHWCHLELARYFDIDDCVLSPETADDIWNRAQAKLTSGISAQQLIRDSNVKLICTTDDPADSLEHHLSFQRSGCDIRMLPAWRPDKAMAVENAATFNAYLQTLSAAAGIEINSYAALIEALRKRHDFFHECGCRLSDHGLSYSYFLPTSDSTVAAIFDKVRSGKQVTAEEDEQFKTAMMLEFGRMDSEKGWAQQLHLGPLRSVNKRMLGEVGPDTGFDSIGDWSYAEKLGGFLNALNDEHALPKTILYNLNPRDNEVLATMIGNFQEGPVVGKMQMGSGWWFMDQKDGMERQIEALSQMGSLSRFVGMLTDSRSFLSYTRHEYFRRILCNLLGSDMAMGFVPHDFDLVGGMVENIAYNNAVEYFNFDS
ncbi:Uronate isomerase [Rubripirellula obstinata]|uniref:Uronate isomerase n=1 Tax=Rubripirellula obstinata TaxID=406547 RepID=A0A5B1CDX1_9BACT|nr:glucuronate isomerase [Rubripirellula obstinata]KAA1258402.1 Uronate isomerase [Rubripirellula obstinata]